MSNAELKSRLQNSQFYAIHLADEAAILVNPQDSLKFFIEMFAESLRFSKENEFQEFECRMQNVGVKMGDEINLTSLKFVEKFFNFLGTWYLSYLIF